MSQHKLVAFCVIILLLALTIVGRHKYLDWDNAQMARGLARDFPELVALIERTTGDEIDITSSCHETQEKFAAGVRTCELSAVKINASVNRMNAHAEVQKSPIFKYIHDRKTPNAFKMKYRNTTSCTFGVDSDGDRTIGVSCLIGIREPNERLIIEEFSRVAEMY